MGQFAIAQINYEVIFIMFIALIINKYSQEECYWHYWTKFHFSCLGQSAPTTTQQLICHEKCIERNNFFMNTQQCYALILSNACNIEFFQAIKTGSELGLKAENNALHFNFNGQK